MPSLSGHRAWSRCAVLTVTVAAVSLVVSAVPARVAVARRSASEAAMPADLFLLPVPAHVTRADGFLGIDQRFTVAIDGYRDALLDHAARRLLARLQRQTGIPVSAVPLVAGAGTLRIRCAGADAAFLTEDADERYTLEVGAAGATLTAPTVSGVLRGLATFLQLVRLDAAGVRAPAVRIEDAPRFAWRGLMLDVARHFAGPDVLIRTLDAMEAVKLNVLHLHLSDHEGFRVESRRYPKLQATASSGGQFYTQADIRSIVAAARERGIRVVPEFEMPGHVQSILVAYPELWSGPTPFTRGRTADTMNAVLDPTREATYAFITGLLGEMATLFPDRLVHVAGDEVSGAEWQRSPRIASYMAAHGMKTPHDLQAHFTKRVVAIVQALGKQPIVWDEAVQPGLPPGVVVQAWRSSKMVQRSTAAGHRTIVSAGYYLDHGLPATTHYAVDPYDSRAMGVPPAMLQAVKGTPLEPFVSDAMVAADAPELDEHDRSLVAGGEMALWTELIQEPGIEMHTWPRSAAIAERFWSPASVRDAASLRRRLEVLSTDLELQGLRHRVNGTLALRRLASGGDAEPLVILAGAVEPQRYLARILPTLMGSVQAPGGGIYFPPMNRFADAVPPESPVAVAFNDAVARIGTERRGNSDAHAIVRARLEAWRDNDAHFARVAEGSALLQEVVPVSREVKTLAEVGLEALAAVDHSTRLDPGRIAALRTVLAPYLQADAMNTNIVAAITVPHPSHGLAIAIVPGVAALVDQAAGPR